MGRWVCGLDAVTVQGIWTVTIRWTMGGSRMDRKLGIFGGTTEGRLLAETCTACRIPALVSVATEYGRGLLGESPFLTVHTGRMDEETMTRWMEDNGLTDVIDATHPYAREASDNIRKACARSGASYHRLVREGTGTGADGGTAEQNGGIAGQNGGMEEQNGGGTGQNPQSRYCG